MSNLQNGVQYIYKVEPLLRPIINQAGPPPLKSHTNYLQELVIAILSQQVSSKAAQTMYYRLIGLFNHKFPSNEALAKRPIDDLRGIGISGVKARYIHELAEAVANGKLPFDIFDSLSDAEIIAELTTTRGIGEWTAQVFLIFCMGRLDVLTPGDLGIRMAIQKLLDLEVMPTPQDVERIAEERHWAPYRSIACWYLWRSLSDDLMLYDSRLTVQ